jgi:hypothetical protein
VATHRDTIPLPLALHLAAYMAIGLFFMFAGPLNLIDPVKIFPNGVLFLAVGGFCWGYVFGVIMGRREAVLLGLAASALSLGLAGYALSRGDLPLAALLAGIGAYGLLALGLYRRWVIS